MYLIRLALWSFAVVLAAFTAVSVSAQTATPTPPEDPPEVVFTEEIKVNIAAFNIEGSFASGLKKEDVVINEDGRLHQAVALQRIPANVLILLDTGGESRQVKNIKTTRATAQQLIGLLEKDDRIALMQFHDRTETLSDWSTDRTLLFDVLEKKLNFGTRSRFTEAIDTATDYLLDLKSENRHLVLITDGLDSVAGQEQRTEVLRRLISTNINVHVLSYTELEQQVVEQRRKSISGGGRRAIELPPGADIPIPGKVQPVPIMTVNTDRAMIKKNNERGEALKRSQRELTQLTEDTNGVMYLPEKADDMPGKTTALAKNIDSQYVITYIPKRPLNESPKGETRVIEVTSRRDDVIIQARRKLLVNTGK
jgi:hypothetical protein